MEIEDENDSLELNNNEDLDLLYILTNNLKPVKMNLQSLFLLRGITIQLEMLAKSKKRHENFENESFKQILEDLKYLDDEIKNNTNKNILTNEEKPKYYSIINNDLKVIEENKLLKINTFINNIINLQNSNKNTINKEKENDKMEIEEEIDSNDNNEINNNIKNKKNKNKLKNSKNNEFQSKKDISKINIPKSIKKEIENIYHEDKYTKEKIITLENKIFEEDMISKTEMNKRNELKIKLEKIKNNPKIQNSLSTTDTYPKNENSKPIYSKQFYLIYEFKNIKLTRKYIWFKLIKEKPELNLSYYIITKDEANKKETFHIYIQSDFNIYLNITTDDENPKILLTPFNIKLDDKTSNNTITPKIFTCQSIKVMTENILKDNNYLTNMNIEKTLLKKPVKTKQK